LMPLFPWFVWGGGFFFDLYLARQGRIESLGDAK
jgi:hypothetical protein